MRRLQVEEVDMDLYEATAILKAVKTFEDIDGRGEAYAKAEAAEELAEIVRTFVEDAAELGGFYTDLMCAVGEGDEVGIGADDPYADFQVGRFRIHLVHEGERYGANKSLVYGDSISHSYPNIGEHENDCQKYGHGLPLVEFYDMGRDFFLPEGQLVTSYYLSTLLGMGRVDTDIAEMDSLCLQGDIPAWTISGDDLKTVAERLHAVRDAYEFDPPTSTLNTLEQDCKTASRETAGSPGDALDFRGAL